MMNVIKQELNCAEQLFAAAEEGNIVGLRELLKKATTEDVNAVNTNDKVSRQFLLISRIFHSYWCQIGLFFKVSAYIPYYGQL